MTDQPNSCPYHRLLGHTLEDCFVFKDWLEQSHQQQRIRISKKYLLDSSQVHTKNVVVHTVNVVHEQITSFPIFQQFPQEIIEAQVRRQTQIEHEQNQTWTLVTVRGSQSGPGEQDDSWTLVTRKERKVKPNAHIPQPVQPKPKPKPLCFAPKHAGGKKEDSKACNTSHSHFDSRTA